MGQRNRHPIPSHGQPDASLLRVSACTGRASRRRGNGDGRRRPSHRLAVWLVLMIPIGCDVLQYRTRTLPLHPARRLPGGQRADLVERGVVHVAGDGVLQAAGRRRSCSPGRPAASRPSCCGWPRCCRLPGTRTTRSLSEKRVCNAAVPQALDSRGTAALCPSHPADLTASNWR